MNNLRHSTIVLGTNYHIRQFMASTTAMSNLDYDLVELVSLIVDLSTVVKGAEERILDFCESYKSLGSIKGEHTDDGIILTESLKPLALEILRQIKATELFEEDGTFPYRFADLKHNNIILEPLSKIE